MEHVDRLYQSSKELVDEICPEYADHVATRLRELQQGGDGSSSSPSHAKQHGGAGSDALRPSLLPPSGSAKSMSGGFTGGLAAGAQRSGGGSGSGSGISASRSGAVMGESLDGFVAADGEEFDVAAVSDVDAGNSDKRASMPMLPPSGSASADFGALGSAVSGQRRGVAGAGAGGGHDYTPGASGGHAGGASGGDFVAASPFEVHSDPSLLRDVAEELANAVLGFTIETQSESAKTMEELLREVRSWRHCVARDCG